MRLQRAFALPPGRHLPGAGPRPRSGPVAEAAAAARHGFDPARWRAGEAYLYGFDLLAGGFFWEAHEVWEPAWMRCPPNSRERAVLQGLIQSANAGLKSVMRRDAAVARLLRLAGALFAEGAGAAGAGMVLGVDAARAAAALRRLQAAGSTTDAARAIAACSALQPICIIMQ